MGIRFSDMESASTFQANDIVPIVSGGNNKTITGGKIKDYIMNVVQPQIDQKQDVLDGAAVTGIDFNNMTESKNYFVNCANASNCPISNASGNYGFLLVSRISDTLFLQTFYRYSSNSNPSNVRRYVRTYLNNRWYDWVSYDALDASIVRASGVPTSVTLPNITRYGNVVIIHFAGQIPAGTYTNLYNVTPTPNNQQHATLMLGSNPVLITIRTNGVVGFNNSVTVTGSPYLIGQLVYLCN